MPEKAPAAGAPGRGKELAATVGHGDVIKSKPSLQRNQNNNSLQLTGSNQKGGARVLPAFGVSSWTVVEWLQLVERELLLFALFWFFRAVLVYRRHG